MKLFADPFYRNGPNDQGIGWNVLASLSRVAKPTSNDVNLQEVSCNEHLD